MTSWTNLELKKLIELRKDGFSFNICAKRLGRSAMSCTGAYNYWMRNLVLDWNLIKRVVRLP